MDMLPTNQIITPPRKFIQWSVFCDLGLSFSMYKYNSQALHLP